MPRSFLLVVFVLAGALSGCLEDDRSPERVMCPRIPDGAGTLLYGEVYRADGGSAEDSYIRGTGPGGGVVHTRTQPGTSCFALLAQEGDWTVLASQDGW